MAGPAARKGRDERRTASRREKHRRRDRSRDRLPRRNVCLQGSSRRWFADESLDRQRQCAEPGVVRRRRRRLAVVASRGRHSSRELAMLGNQKTRGWGRWVVILLPYLWLAVFFLAPFIIVLKISLSQSVLAQPPYTPVLDLSEGWQGLKTFAAQLSLDSFRLLGSDSLYLLSYLKSLQVAAISTVILFVLGYPIAYGMARAPKAWQPMLVMAVVLPFWTAFLIRIYALINILQRDGLLNDVLMRLNIIDAPAVWLSSDTAIYIGIVYSYLPFMVLPLYASLER